MGITSLELLNLSKVFGRSTVALDNFSLTVRGGEFMTLLGPSGCGKTTALNCIAGLISPTSGEIRLDGQRIDLLPPEKRGFGMVFQNYALFPHLTVEQNVAFGLEIQRLPKSEVRQRVDAILRLVQLEPERFASRFPRELSGGQQQRLALARAAVLQPSLLLLDEPLSNLDAKLRADMRFELKRLHTQLGLTSIYVSHDQAEALSLSDRVVVMRDGLIMQVGTPEEIYRQPATLFVADFVGFKNRFALRVEGSDSRGLVLAGPGLRLESTTVDERLVPGAEVIACFRPEDVQVTAAGSEGCLGATVEVIEFVGQAYEMEARLDGDSHQVHLRAPLAMVRGERVCFHVPPERVVVFPAEPENGSRR